MPYIFYFSTNIYFCQLGMKSATLEEWEKLWEIYLKEEDVHEQVKLRNALAAPRNPDILKRFVFPPYHRH